MESDQKVTDISETTVTKETKTVVDEKSTDKLEYKVDRRFFGFKMCNSLIIFYDFLLRFFDFVEFIII
jgi:hypothetical protein